MKILQRNFNRRTFVVWEMKKNVSQRDTWRTPSFRGDCFSVWDVPAAHNWFHLLRCNHQNSCIYRNLQHLKINWTMRNSQLDISSRMEWHPTLHTPAWPKFSPVSATASFRRDFGHRACPIWGRLIISYVDIWNGEFTETNHEPQTPWKQTSPKKFRQWQQTSQNMARRVQSCLDANGGHFQHMLWCHISYTMR